MPSISPQFFFFSSPFGWNYHMIFVLGICFFRFAISLLFPLHPIHFSLSPPPPRYSSRDHIPFIFSGKKNYHASKFSNYKTRLIELEIKLLTSAQLFSSSYLWFSKIIRWTIFFSSSLYVDKCKLNFIKNVDQKSELFLFNK